MDAEGVRGGGVLLLKHYMTAMFED